MSTLTALARAQAFAAGRAQPLATVRHLHLHERPLVLIPYAMAGEANAPLAAMVGTAEDEPELLVVAQPRNPDDRFAFAARLADVLVPYVDSFAAVAEPVPVDRGRDVRYRFTNAPQVWVPNPGGVDFLRLFGRSTRFRGVEGEYAVPASVPLLGRWLTFFAGAAEVPGSSLLLNGVQALSSHWATGQSSAEDAQLAALMAWLDPPPGRTVFEAAAAAEDPAVTPPPGPATDPAFDNHVLAPLLSAAQPDVAELSEVLRAQLLPTWSLMWRALGLLRTLPPGSRVAGRWDADRDSYSGFLQHLAEGGPPQPRRDGAVAAAARLARLENAAARYAVQRAFDDPLVMAEHRLAGAAFAGEVTLAKADRVDDSGKRPVLRPRIMVVTSEPVRVAPGAVLTSPARPAQKATVISVSVAVSSGDGSARTEVLLELSGGMGRKLVAEPGSVPEVGERLLLTTLSEAYRPGGAFPEPDQTPWTHGGPPAPRDPVDEVIEEPSQLPDQ
ncbi:hypothetical protein [Couchioplanes caeruleus]|uniref:Uncharacterized protein n=2 Tax=Couchioplanes caeruleus TaxID=56438 RepID=A0A1K0FCZ1_9ACTN|nr:hypothetical protein [Couchioplanes caeruleus]OJF10701.1 hypothetical protein BG844_30600 [Couchioplanes caeruleus subsp. caeruleus]ROP29930.1 hypothetical protein EDD30_2758 [Couchioplanes caeruleus]